MIEKISYAVNRFANGISGVVILLVMLMTVIDVLGRFLLNSPLPGTIEVVELALVVILFLAFGFTEESDMHVSIDTLYEIFPKSIQLVLYEIGGVISFITAALMGWQLYVYAVRMMTGGYISAVLSIPYGPVAFIAALGSLCYALAIFSNMIKMIKKYKLLKKEGNRDVS